MQHWQTCTLRTRSLAQAIGGQVTLSSVHARAIVFHPDREARQATPRLRLLVQFPIQ
jgi:hypothetical protein